MAVYYIDALDGVATVKVANPQKIHDIAFRGDGSVSSGVMEIKGRKPGSDTYETIPDADALDLSLPESVQFYGSADSFEFTISGFSGVANKIIITDSEGEGHE